MKKTAILLCIAMVCTAALAGCGAGKQTGAASSEAVSQEAGSAAGAQSEPETPPEAESSPEAEPAPEAKPEPETKPEPGTEPAPQPQEETGTPSLIPEGGETAYGSGGYVVTGDNGDTLLYQDGRLVLHYFEYEDGKDCYTEEDDTIGYSPYYGMTLEQAVSQLEQNGIRAVVTEN